MTTNAAPDPRPLPIPTKTDLARVWREVNGGNRWPSDVDAFVDAALATLTALASAAAPAQGVPEGWKLVLVPDEVAPDEPDWDECVRQAETATGIKVDRNTLSILVREVRRWIAHRGLAASPPPPAQEAPIDMVLHCPACGLQHVDAPEADDLDRRFYPDPWTNPPHRSHLCHGCGHIWRPADVPTNGVAAVKTKGKNDSPAQEARATADGLTRWAMCPETELPCSHCPTKRIPCEAATKPAQETRQPDGWRPIERQGTVAARWPSVAEFTLRMFRRTQIEIGVPRDKLMPDDFCAAVSWLVMQAPAETVLTKAKASSGAPAGCYPEEWGPSTDRRLTCACGNPDPAHWMPLPAAPGAHVTPPSEPARQGLTGADAESRAMFVARLENEKRNGQHNMTVDGVLALLGDCDYLASRSLSAHGITGAATSGAEGEGE